MAKRLLALEAPFGQTITLRKSGMKKKDWAYVVKRFGITQVHPDDILSITVEGDDGYGHLQISIIVEEEI